MSPQEERDSGDFAPDARAVANVGKRFYTWATVGTFSGAAFLVSSLWQTLQSLRILGFEFTHQGWALLFSAIVMIAFGFATEPGQQTALHQKVQKVLIMIANTFLLYFAVIGGTAVVTG